MAQFSSNAIRAIRHAVRQVQGTPRGGVPDRAIRGEHYNPGTLFAASGGGLNIGGSVTADIKDKDSNVIQASATIYLPSFATSSIPGGKSMIVAYSAGSWVAIGFYC